MVPSTSVDTALAVVTPSDPASAWRHSFPSPDLVSAAAGMFSPLPAWDGAEGPRSRIVIGPGCVQVTRHDPARAERTADRAREAAWKSATMRAQDGLLPDRLKEALSDLEPLLELVESGLLPWSEVEAHVVPLAQWSDHLQARIERIEARADSVEVEPSRITGWSRKSRSNMVRTLLQLDYSPMVAEGRPSVMQTLTLPRNWLLVAPTGKVYKQHVQNFWRAYERTWGAPMVCTWKQEYQDRKRNCQECRDGSHEHPDSGRAPHSHLQFVPPLGVNADGETFAVWQSRTWSNILLSYVRRNCTPEQYAAYWCGQECWTGGRGSACCDHGRSRVAGTALDYRDGARMTDPRRLAVYFSKHGSFASKDYQNEAPPEWVENGSVGRFWGYRGLSKGVAVVEVDANEADAAARLLRRWQDRRGFRVQREVWRTNTRTGVQYRRRSGVWVGARMRGTVGYVACNDGPALAATVARYLDAVRPTGEVTRTGAAVRRSGFRDWSASDLRNAGVQPAS